jgi:hypothetical protein
MKFEMPRQSEEHFKKFFTNLVEELNVAFRNLIGE